jgi:P-type E1-E2 ATPase
VAIVTATNNYMKERQFRKLNDVKDDKFIRVIRNGEDVQIKMTDIVVGDIVKLTTGCQLPADGLYIDGDGKNALFEQKKKKKRE